MAAEEPSFLVSLASGGAAGIAVDISLFPLDTIKTRSAAKCFFFGKNVVFLFRLQSKQGFLAAGGFRNIYSGLS